MAGRVKVAKLNIDENPVTANRFGVRSIPTLLVLKGGKEVDRLVGVQPKQEILRRLESALKTLTSLRLKKFRPFFHQRRLRSFGSRVGARVDGGLRLILFGRSDRLPLDVHLIQRVQRDQQRVDILGISIEERDDGRIRLLVEPKVRLRDRQILPDVIVLRLALERLAQRLECLARADPAAASRRRGSICSAGSCSCAARARSHADDGFLVSSSRGVTGAEIKRRNRRIRRIAKRDAELVRGGVQLVPS